MASPAQAEEDPRAFVFGQEVPMYKSFFSALNRDRLIGKRSDEEYLTVLQLLNEINDYAVEPSVLIAPDCNLLVNHLARKAQNKDLSEGERLVLYYIAQSSHY